MEDSSQDSCDQCCPRRPSDSLLGLDHSCSARLAFHFCSRADLVILRMWSCSAVTFCFLREVLCTKFGEIRSLFLGWARSSRFSVRRTWWSVHLWKKNRDLEKFNEFAIYGSSLYVHVIQVETWMAPATDVLYFAPVVGGRFSVPVKRGARSARCTQVVFRASICSTVDPLVSFSTLPRLD